MQQNNESEQITESSAADETQAPSVSAETAQTEEADEARLPRREETEEAQPQEPSACETDDVAGDAAATQDPAPLSRAEEKKKAALYLVFAAIAFAGIYIVQIFHVFDPLFKRVYYGNLTTIFFYILNAAFWIPLLVVLYRQVKKRTGFKIFRRAQDELSLKRSLIIYACAVVTIFIVSAALGFELKVVFELGKRVTGMQLITNAVTYVHGGIKLLVGIAMLELVQEAAQILYRGKYADIIPWGGLALALLVGFGDVIVAYAGGTATAFVWMYIAFDLLYGVIYLLGKKHFYTTYFVSLIIYIL